MLQRGFTLIEFAVVLAIVAILVSLATPSILALMGNADLRSTTMSLAGDIGAARAEALRTRSSITVCPGTVDSGCTGDWNNGWVVFRDLNNDGNYSSADRLVREQQGVDGNTTVTGPNNFVYRNSGAVAAAGVLSVRNPKATSGRDLQVIQGGRVISNVVSP